MAIAADGNVLDSRLCISYHTIENRGPIPRELRAKFGAWIFGCDDCLEACPVGAHNTTINPELSARNSDDATPALAPLLALDEAAFRERYQGRPIIRAKRDGFVRNVCVALGNVGTATDLTALEGAMSDDSALVRGHAAWAVGRLGGRLELEVAQTLENALAMEQDPYVREELRFALAELHFASG
jgi:epoxyqueuosine reductase